MARRHATLADINSGVFVCVLISLLVRAGARAQDKPNYDESGRKLTREYHLRQGALRGLIVKPSRQYDLQSVEMFLGVPYAAPPIGNMRFMPPGSALPWPGVRLATKFAPVCPQMLPIMKKDNPPSLGRQHYINRMLPFLRNESEDCLYLNIYVPYREQKTKKFPVAVFIHGDSFEWSSGNPYDGKILSAYGNIMVVTINYRLGILGFMKPSLTEHVYGNNGLLDQLAALQWIKDNVEDLNGDPGSVTLMGHGTGAACVNFLMMSPISNGLFHRAILMSGSALSDWAMTKDPTQFTLQVAQNLNCSSMERDLMTCLQAKPLFDIMKIQILARDFETRLGPVVAGSFIPNDPATTMDTFPNLLSKYQLMSGVVESESYHDFGVIELAHGILDNQRDDIIRKLSNLIFDSAESIAAKEILKHYSASKGDPQRWSVETNREVILNIMSDARSLAPLIKTVNYHSKANSQSYFYVFGHNSESTEYAALKKSVHGEEVPYVLGVPLGGANTHFHSEYTQREKLLSEVIMRLWTNFIKIGTPNTQSVNEYYTIERADRYQYNIEWPEYNVDHQSYLKLDIPPFISSLYRSNHSKFWLDTLPNKMKKYIVDPLLGYTPIVVSHKPKTQQRSPEVRRPPETTIHQHSPSTYGRIRPYSPPVVKPDTDALYREIQSIKHPARTMPPGLMEKVTEPTTPKTVQSKEIQTLPIKTSGMTVTIIVVLSILFLIVNISICTVLYFKKRKLQLRERTFETRHSQAEIGDYGEILGAIVTKDDKGALQTLKNGCNVLKSMSIDKIRQSSIKKKKVEPCKTPKSDDSGGFRERFQLRRHLSTSTLDAHTKVRDWIASEMIHRCSPKVLRKSNSDIQNDKQSNSLKPFTRSEELIAESKNAKSTNKSKSTKSNPHLITSKEKKAKMSEKTTSTSALGSHSSINTSKQSSLGSIRNTTKSSDSLKSKESESVKSKKVSVAIDATPAARTNSILQQEPIELSKSLDLVENLSKHSTNDSNLRRSKTETDCNKPEASLNAEEDQFKPYKSVINFALKDELKSNVLQTSHKHSKSDPVTDINYEKLSRNKPYIANIPPPVLFRNEINVTSREDETRKTLTPAEALLTIQRRNYPKVLPDLPKSQKRLSLQPSSFQTFKSYIGSLETSKTPPQPPPRTTTLDRRLAYKNTKPLSSFDSATPKNKVTTLFSSQNYENIESLSSSNETSKVDEVSVDQVDSGRVEKEFPRIIIASSDTPLSEPRIVIKACSNQVDAPANAPRVTLPVDFHSYSESCSSFCSDDEIEELPEDFCDDKLLQELVGGVESPDELLFDSKGPSTIYEKKLEIVPVQIKTIDTPRHRDNYVCVSSLMLPDISRSEQTAQIKPNFGLNKLQHRSASINKPAERAIKVKHKRNNKPSILNKSFKTHSKTTGDKNKNSTSLDDSGSSNDTESSTGTVKKMDYKKE